MCLGTVILAESDLSLAQKLSDVISVEVAPGLVRVRTLFDETHDLHGVTLCSIDLSKGVTITLAHQEDAA
ncbi:hypothetical protein CKO11_03580 [Rhodobacter sp. TJ_12]|uniref:CooT family nickel-binding protein n=1 Tax=Rhodobacter sp. TJ_12 TaxID=2029399 RepID=UPI001CBCB4FC|nr:CooT family nickel-binding protein [Rhodobacter sp. TJ_12]MBZ4021538.1 hypothetical protein [Rhodobacter sp. TJ_12]